MRSKLTTTLSRLALVIWTLPLAACVTVQPPSLPVTNHPRLPDPPSTVVDALEGAARTDEDAANWTIDLDNFLRKQDAT